MQKLQHKLVIIIVHHPIVLLRISEILDFSKPSDSPLKNTGIVINLTNDRFKELCQNGFTIKLKFKISNVSGTVSAQTGANFRELVNISSGSSALFKIFLETTEAFRHNI